MLILIVENHPDTAELLTRLFVHDGHEVESVATCAQAIQASRDCDYDLLISDIGLPDCDGWALLARMRQHCWGKAIALSGYGTPADLEKSRAAGFNAHLTKPVTLETLRKTVAELMGPLAAPAPAARPVSKSAS